MKGDCKPIQLVLSLEHQWHLSVFYCTKLHGTMLGAQMQLLTMPISLGNNRYIYQFMTRKQQYFLLLSASSTA
jgi:hypothetical protein